jgi:hypothetical protein
MFLRYFKIALTLFFVLTSTSLLAEESDDSSIDLHAARERVMSNTSHQFIYAFFGKELLLHYINNSDDEALLKDTTKSELAHLSKPFNSKVGLLIRILLSVIYFATIGYFIVRLLFFGMEMGWLAQRKGSTHLSKEEVRAFWVKLLLVGGLVLIPLRVGGGLSVNVFDALVFDLLGRAHSYGDEAVSELVLSQQQSMLTVRIPEANGKIDAGVALNTFMACVRLDSSRHNSQSSITKALKLYATDSDSLIKGVLSSGSCHLSVQFGYDTKSDEKIEKMRTESPGLAGVMPNMFTSAQKEVFRDILIKTLNKASQYSDIFTRPKMAQSSGGWSDPVRLSEEFVMRPWTRNVRSERELAKWELQCLDFDQDMAHSTITKDDRLLHFYMTSRCLSYQITKALLYPEGVYDGIDVFLTNQVLKDRAMPLCVDSLSSISDGPVGTYKLSAEAPLSQNIDQYLLETCISRVCSAGSLRNGGLYACTNSLDLYERRLFDHQIKDRGIMMLGFYMYNLFSASEPSSFSKAIYNNLVFSFSQEQPALPARSGDNNVWGTIPVTIPPLRDDHDNQWLVQYSLFNGYDSGAEAAVLKQVKPSVKMPTMNALVDLERLTTCLRNPLQVVDDLVCKNIPQEFSQFGMNIFRLTVGLKTLLVAGDTIKRVGFAAKDEMTISERGKVKGALKMLKMVVGPEATSGAMGVLHDQLANSSFSMVDEFSVLNSGFLREWSTAGKVILGFVTVVAGTSSVVSGFIDTLLLLSLGIGLALAFVIPLMPLIMILYALGKFVFLLLRVLLLSGFKLVDVIFETEQELLSEGLDKLWADWLALFLKLPLTVIGVVLAWLMSNVIIAHVMGKLDMNLLLNLGENKSFTGYFDAVVVLILSFSIVYIIYNMVLTLIESFYDFTVEWVLGTMGQAPLKDNLAIKWQDTGQVLGQLGRRG